VVRFAGRKGNSELEIATALKLPPAPPITGDPRHETARWKGLVGVELAPYTVLCRSFREAIEGVQASSPVVPATFADGVACMQVMDAIRTSAREGGRLVAV
jgi:predicted dehydrogenase